MQFSQFIFVVKRDVTLGQVGSMVLFLCIEDGPRWHNVVHNIV